MHNNVTARSIQLVVAVFIAAVLVAIGVTWAPASASAQELSSGATKLAAQDQSFSYTLGQTASGVSEDWEDHYYGFAVASPADISYRFNASGARLWWSIETSGGSTMASGYAYPGSAVTGTVYLPAGGYQVYLYGASYRETQYSFVLNKQTPTLSLSKKSGTIKSTTQSLQVPFITNCSNDYASSNLSVVVSNPKVASAYYSLGTGGAGTINIYPAGLGTTTVKVSLVGAGTVKYTVYVTQTTKYLAKGSTTKLDKPIGVKKPKYSSKSKSKAVVNKKSGKVRAKKGGRVKIIAKKGKKKYTYNLVITDYMKLAREAYDYLEEYVPNPDKLKINYAYSGLDQNIYSGVKLPVVYLDYSYGNGTGGWSRNKMIAYYDEVLDMKYFTASTANEVMSKKSLNKKQIRK